MSLWLTWRGSLTNLFVAEPKSVVNPPIGHAVKNKQISIFLASHPPLLVPQLSCEIRDLNLVGWELA